MYTRFYGVLTDDDLRRQAKNVAKDPRIKPGVRELVDLSEVERVEAESQSLKVIIEMDRAHRDKFKGQMTAIVAPKDYLFGLSRMYEMLSELHEAPAMVRVFRTIEEAQSWLGIPVEKI